VGALAGGYDSVKWAMLQHIAVVTPGNRRRYAAFYEQFDLPKVYLSSPRAIEACFEAWGLTRG
jgi:hypothetical protein